MRPAGGFLLIQLSNARIYVKDVFVKVNTLNLLRPDHSYIIFSIFFHNVL